MSESPSFPLYANDFVGGRVATYDLDEIGAYSLLLAFDWTLNGLPTETEKLAKLCRVSHRKFQKIWLTIAEQFPERDGRRFNQRLALERAKKGVKSTQASDAAAKRWHSDGNADASISHPENHAPTTTTNGGSTTSGGSNAREDRESSAASTADLQRDVSGVAPITRLVAAANKGLAEHLSRPQPIPRIFVGQAASIHATEAIQQAGVPIDFAESCVFSLAKAHTADGPVNSLRYFAAATVRAWQAELARTDAERSGVTPGTATRSRAPRHKPTAGEASYAAGLAAFSDLEEAS